MADSNKQEVRNVFDQYYQALEACIIAEYAVRKGGPKPVTLTKSWESYQKAPSYTLDFVLLTNANQFKEKFGISADVTATKTGIDTDKDTEKNHSLFIASEEAVKIFTHHLSKLKTKLKPDVIDTISEAFSLSTSVEKKPFLLLTHYEKQYSIDLSGLETFYRKAFSHKHQLLNESAAEQLDKEIKKRIAKINNELSAESVVFFSADTQKDYYNDEDVFRKARHFSRDDNNLKVSLLNKADIHEVASISIHWPAHLIWKAPVTPANISASANATATTSVLATTANITYNAQNHYNLIRAIVAKLDPNIDGVNEFKHFIEKLAKLPKNLIASQKAINKILFYWLYIKTTDKTYNLSSSINSILATELNKDNLALTTLKALAKNFKNLKSILEIYSANKDYYHDFATDPYFLKITTAVMNAFHDATTNNDSEILDIFETHKPSAKEGTDKSFINIFEKIEVVYRARQTRLNQLRSGFEISGRDPQPNNQAPTSTSPLFNAFVQKLHENEQLSPLELINILLGALRHYNEHKNMPGFNFAAEELDKLCNIEKVVIASEESKYNIAFYSFDPIVSLFSFRKVLHGIKEQLNGPILTSASSVRKPFVQEAEEAINKEIARLDRSLMLLTYPKIVEYGDANGYKTYAQLFISSSYRNILIKFDSILSHEGIKPGPLTSSINSTHGRLKNIRDRIEQLFKQNLDPGLEGTIYDRQEYVVNEISYALGGTLSYYKFQEALDEHPDYQNTDSNYRTNKTQIHKHILAITPWPGVDIEKLNVLAINLGHLGGWIALQKTCHAYTSNLSPSTNSDLNSDSDSDSEPHDLNKDFARKLAPLESYQSPKSSPRGSDTGGDDRVSLTSSQASASNFSTNSNGSSNSLSLFNNYRSKLQPSPSGQLTVSRTISPAPTPTKAFPSGQ